MSGVASNPAPPSEEVICLTCVDLAFAVITFAVAVDVIRKHGKPGRSVWTNLICFALARAVADIYLLATRHEPLKPNAVSGVTNSAVVSTMPNTISGCLYLCNIILPMACKGKQPFYIFISFILVNVVGIVLTFVPAQNAQELGNMILLNVILGICVWMLPTYQKIKYYSKLDHPNAAAAKKMFWAAVVAAPFWLIHISAGTVYAFLLSPPLDPVTGAFATIFILGFWMWLGAVAALLAGGWLGSKYTLDDASTVEHSVTQIERVTEVNVTTANGERRATIQGEASDSLERRLRTL